ncbi:MAG: DMT family transporter [Planctomycetes bacterium]|nr:DMT family transporter [Planctomycetota bacterium]MCB9910134.1 DMT family transporter [Planctomycetota bacterium]MCB9913099.1 DMT family transporter [Planctomycetota bacterium]
MSHSLAIAAGLFSAAAWGVASLLFAKFLREHAGERPPSAAGANLFKNCLALLVFLCLWPLLGGAWPGAAISGWLLLSGVLGFALGDSLYFAALPRCGVQAAAMIGQLNVPLAAVMGYLWNGERLGPLTVLGMFVAMAGVLLVLSDPVPIQQRGRSAYYRSGVIFALLNAVTIASGIFLGHVGIEDVDILPGTLMRMAGGIGGAFLVAPLWGALARALGVVDDSPAKETRNLIEPFRRRAWWKPLILASVAGSVIGLLPYHIALRELPSGIAAVMFATTPLFTLPLGKLMGERFGVRSVVGTLVGFAGVIGVISTLAQAAAPVITPVP